MTREEVVAMAKKTGLWANYSGPIGVIERFAALVAAAQREKDAKVCEEIKGVKLQGYEYAAAIRSQHD